MQWISTTSVKTAERAYNVYLWNKKFPEDAVHRLVYSISMENAYHDSSEDGMRAELLAGLYFILKKSGPREVNDGRNLNWHVSNPEVQSFLMEQPEKESLHPLFDYFRVRLNGITMVPMAGKVGNEAIITSQTWPRVELPYFWHKEELEAVFGTVQLTQSALVKFSQLSVRHANASAIKILRDRLKSEHMTEFELRDDYRAQQLEKYGVKDMKVFYHQHIPGVKLLFVINRGESWRLVDVFLFNHQKNRNAGKTAKEES